MWCITNRNIFKDDIAFECRPRCRRFNGTFRFLLQMEYFDDSFHRDKIHLELPVVSAHCMGRVNDCESY